MYYTEVVRLIADILKQFDSEHPVHKAFRPGIGPFGEPQIVRLIADRLSAQGLPAQTKRTPDLDIQREWAIEFKIVRPFGDNGREAENWSVNMLHPYTGNVSLIGDAVKLSTLENYRNKGLFVIGYEHNPPRIGLNPLLDAFELIAGHVMQLALDTRIEECREGLVHPEHQVTTVCWLATETAVTVVQSRSNCSAVSGCLRDPRPEGQAQQIRQFEFRTMSVVACYRTASPTKGRRPSTTRWTRHSGISRQSAPITR